MGWEAKGVGTAGAATCLTEAVVTRALRRLAAVAGVVAVCGVASAQAIEGPAGVVEASREEPDSACYPRCRSGFLCSAGRCISACNPPCAQGEACTAEGECEARPPAVAAAPVAAAPVAAAPVTPAPVASSGGSRQPSGIHEHDGFYLQLGLGLGYLASTHAFDGFDVFSGVARRRTHGLNGLAQLGSFTLGGTPARGLVIGGGIWSTNVWSPKLSVDIVTDTGTSHFSATTELLSISLFGPFVAWYPMPDQGLNTLFGLGVNYVATDGFHGENVDGGSWSATGWGLVGAVGYEFWVSQQWSLGAQARATFTYATNGSHQYTAVVPALCVVGTFH